MPNSPQGLGFLYGIWPLVLQQVQLIIHMQRCYNRALGGPATYELEKGCWNLRVGGAEAKKWQLCCWLVALSFLLLLIFHFPNILDD